MKKFLPILIFITSTYLSYAQGNYTILYTHLYGVDSFNKPNTFYDKIYGALLVQGDSLLIYRLLKNKKDLLQPFDMNSMKVHHSSLKKKGTNFSYNINFYNEKNAKFIISNDENYEWIIEPDTIVICGFPCIKAKSSTGVTAWFTPSISAQFAPFNYTGLPGTILKIYDNVNHILIEAKEIIALCPPIIYPRDKMNIITLEEMLKKRNNLHQKKKIQWFFN